MTEPRTHEQQYAEYLDRCHLPMWAELVTPMSFEQFRKVVDRFWELVAQDAKAGDAEYEQLAERLCLQTPQEPTDAFVAFVEKYGPDEADRRLDEFRAWLREWRDRTGYGKQERDR